MVRLLTSTLFIFFIHRYQNVIMNEILQMRKVKDLNDSYRLTRTLEISLKGKE